MDRYTAKKLTKEKRQHQTCRVYEVKVDRSHLSQDALKHLTKLFTEAKWFYNYCLGHDNIDNSDTTAKHVPVKVKKDRDWKSAICIETEGLKQIPVDDRKLTVQENRSSAFFDQLSNINNIKVSKVSS